MADPASAAGTLGGLFGANQADKAADQQADAAKYAADLQRVMFEKGIKVQQGNKNQVWNALAPYTSAGSDAQKAYAWELGLGPRPTVGADPLDISRVKMTREEIDRFHANHAPARPQPQGGSGRLALPQRNGAGMQPNALAPQGGNPPTRQDGAQWIGGQWVRPGDGAIWDNDQWVTKGGGLAPQGGAAGGGAGNGAGDGGTKDPKFNLFKVGDRIFQNRDKANAYAKENGVQGELYGGFQKDRAYRMGLREGNAGIRAVAAGTGMLESGRTIKAATQFNQDYASGKRNEYLSKLAGQAGVGLNAVNTGAGIATNAANNIMASYGNIGNALGQGAIGAGDAQSAGTIASGNIFSDMLNGLTSSWNYQKQQGGA